MRAASEESMAAARRTIFDVMHVLFEADNAGRPRATADAGVQATFYDETYTVVALRVACARLGLRGDGSRALLTERLNHRASQV
jgi:hypothetical protein